MRFSVALRVTAADEIGAEGFFAKEFSLVFFIYSPPSGKIRNRLADNFPQISGKIPDRTLGPHDPWR